MCSEVNFDCCRLSVLLRLIRLSKHSVYNCRNVSLLLERKFVNLDTGSSKFDTLSTERKIYRYISSLLFDISEVDINSLKLDAVHCTLMWFKITSAIEPNGSTRDKQFEFNFYSFMRIVRYGIN